MNPSTCKKSSVSGDISLAGPDDRAALFDVWESSVRATHHFLTEDDLQSLIPLAREELARIDPVHCLRDGSGRVCAFIYVEQAKIESLFVAPAQRGSGAGRTLVEHAIRSLNAIRVEVNELNPQAVGFYEHLGFRVTARSPFDGQGRPFPILHMTLQSPL